MRNAVEREEIVDIAMRISRTVLSCGGETYRADECCSRILYAAGADDVEVIALPTALLLTVRFGEEIYNRSTAIMDRKIDLNTLDVCISVSRRLTAGSLEVEQANIILDNALRQKKSVLLQTVLAAASATCFSLVFDGGIAEILCTLIATAIGMGGLVFLDRLQIPKFVSYFISAAIIAGSARLGVLVYNELIISVVIVSGITPMLPGLAMTNAVRDSINGDIVSTSARGIEAIMIAVGIAAAVGMVLSL